tara:strand:- start:18 stop:890 length:873 start_codon:yes stop_codon:yes gene_type:complete
MKKILLLLLLIPILGFSQDQTIKVKITKENPYDVYVGREGSQVDYSKISRDINKSLNSILESREQKKIQLKSLKEIVVNFVKDEAPLIKSSALNTYFSEIKSMLIYYINFHHSMLTKGFYKVESWESFMQKVPDVMIQLFMEIQSLDLFINNSKNTFFKKNGDSAELEIEKITSLILSKYTLKNNFWLFDNGVAAVFKKNRIKKRGTLGDPYIRFGFEGKKITFGEHISADVINAINSSVILTKDKIIPIDFDSIVSKLKKLKELFDLGIITEIEYNTKAQKLKDSLLKD